MTYPVTLIVTVHTNPRAKRAEIMEVNTYLQAMANQLTLHRAVEAVNFSQTNEWTYTVGTPKPDGATWNGQVIANGR